MNLKEFFKEHWEWTLTGAGLLLAAILIWIFAWGLLLGARNASRALGSVEPEKTGVQFEIQKAKALNLR